MRRIDVECTAPWSSHTSTSTDAVLADAVDEHIATIKERTEKAHVIRRVRAPRWHQPWLELRGGAGVWHLATKHDASING